MGMPADASILVLDVGDPNKVTSSRPLVPHSFYIIEWGTSTLLYYSDQLFMPSDAWRLRRDIKLFKIEKDAWRDKKYVSSTPKIPFFGAIEPPSERFFLSPSSDKVGTCDVLEISSLVDNRTPISLSQQLHLHFWDFFLLKKNFFTTDFKVQKVARLRPSSGPPFPSSCLGNCRWIPLDLAHRWL